MKRKILLRSFTLISIIFFLCSSICLAVETTPVHSGIHENIYSYTCDDYFDIFRSEAAENYIYNYYQERKLNLEIIKKITSQTYIEQIREFILEDWTPPFNYDRAAVAKLANQFDKVYDNIYIMQVVEFDFRRKYRNAIVMEESLWGLNQGDSTPQIILHCASDEALPGNRIVYNIDYDEEYGQIANDAVKFLDSIKDIYFDEKVHAEYVRKEKKRQRNNKIKDYLNCWSGNLTQIFETTTADCSIKLFVDLPSFHSRPTEHGPSTSVIYEGWLTMVSNPPLQMDTRDYLMQKTNVYCRIDYRSGIQYNLASIEFDENGQEHWNVLETPEKFEHSPWADKLRKVLAQKFKLSV